MERANWIIHCDHAIVANWISPDAFAMADKHVGEPCQVCGAIICRVPGCCIKSIKTND